MPQHLATSNQLNLAEQWYNVTLESLQRLWQGLIEFIPNLIGAIVVLLVGWVISVAVGRLVAEVLKRLKFNQIFERGNWQEALARAEIKVNASEFIGGIFKWILMIVFLMVASEILGFQEFTVFLNKVLSYLPNVVVAVLIFVATVVVADIAEKLVKAAVGGAKIGYASLAGSVAKWAIWIFAVLAILRQLLIVPDLINILFSALVYGVVAFLVLAFGLSFGLGGKDVAAEMWRDLRNKLRGE